MRKAAVIIFSLPAVDTLYNMYIGGLMDDLLQQGMTAYKAGRREEARNFFISAVKQNPESELAWGWMYQTSVNDKERVYCLKQILRVNPKNEKIRQLLGQLTAPPPVPLQSSPPQAAAPVVSTRKCPHCGEANRVEARRCIYCGRDIVEDKVIPVKKSGRKKAILLGWIVGAITLFAACGLIYGLSLAVKKGVDAIPTPAKTVEEYAWQACTLFVEKQEQVAAFDAQRYNPEGVLRLDNGQYRVDIHYAKLAIIYTCVLSDHSDGKWELISLTATME